MTAAQSERFRRLFRQIDVEIATSKAKAAAITTTNLKASGGKLHEEYAGRRRPLTTQKALHCLHRHGANWDSVIDAWAVVQDYILEPGNGVFENEETLEDFNKALEAMED